MDSAWLERRTPSDGMGSSSIQMDTASDYSSKQEYIPAWKMPISKSFSSAVGEKSGSESGIGSGGERDNSTSSSSDPESCPIELVNRKPLSKEEEGQVIQILLPCIICNRTFSPEALERHNKVCTKVNVKAPYKPDRGKFDTAEQRKKGTKAEYFIPPPNLDDTVDIHSSSFSRNIGSRRSLRGTSCTRSPLNENTLNLHQIGLGPNIGPSPLRRQRSISQSRGERGHPSSEYGEDHFDFGSNNSEESHEANLPSYAKPVAPSDECPFCQRSFGLKAYDRHVEYCGKKLQQKQFEIQPVPKDKIEAMERQEIRSKYRPIKCRSSSVTSLRSVTPSRDFSSMAYKFFGMSGNTNTYNNQLGNFKKSNESIANSCYGDYTRGLRRPSPSPSRQDGSKMSVTNKINNLLSKTFHYPQRNNNSNNSLHPMKINTTSNIPKLVKSSDNLLSGTGSHYTHVSSSGYGQQPMANNSFDRNSRSRSSLHKNFFRSKRVEPEGTENTGTMSSTSSGTASSPLIITPMTFYTKSNKISPNSMLTPEVYRPKGSTLFSQDPSYDPYEMAAKQLEELLKTQPINKNVNKKTARKLGLEKAFESVGVHSDNFLTDNYLRNENNDDSKRLDDEDQFVFKLASGKMDDSYWDEMLQKSNSEGMKEKKALNQTLMPKSETKSQQSDRSIGDSNKSRALSQISSADSGFSRSEVNDAEFEAMESMIVGLGNVPQQSSFKRHYQLPELPQNSLASIHSSISMSRMPFTKRSQSYSHQLSKEEPESPMQLSPSPVFPPSIHGKRRDSNFSASRTESESSPVTTPTGNFAPFCHECGHSYPSGLAKLCKFCPECGEKRVFKL